MLVTARGLAAVFLLAAPVPAAAFDAPSRCALAAGASIPLSSSVLPLGSIGGKQVRRAGWEPRGAPMIGDLIYSWGLILRPRDARFSRIVEARGAAAQARSADGCWFQWDLVWGEGGTVASIAKVRTISDPGGAEGRAGEEPSRLPKVRRGYELVAADRAYSRSHRWIGLWRAEGSAKRTLIVAFDERRFSLLAEVPFRLGTISTLPSMHAEGAQVTVMGATAGLEPIAYLSFRWSPSAPKAR